MSFRIGRQHFDGSSFDSRLFSIFFDNQINSKPIVIRHFGTNDRNRVAESRLCSNECGKP